MLYLRNEKLKDMTEQEAKNDPEMIVILLLSGYARELGEGKDYESITYKLAERIVKLFSKPDVVDSHEPTLLEILQDFVKDGSTLSLSQTGHTFKQACEYINKNTKQ